MGCTNCGTGSCLKKGCKSNGGCATGGCNQLNAFDWLGNMLPPGMSEKDNVYEVTFDAGRKSFYRNENNLNLNIGDWVAVESSKGFDVGHITLGGVTARIQMKKKRFKANDILSIYRKVSEIDVEKYHKSKDLEPELLTKTRKIVSELQMEMKLSRVDLQADQSKATFYYTADQRVDFRDLIKRLAQEFSLKIEMRQIGLRQEASMIGGIGACGRELCCSTWLTNFKTVSTSAARYQNLSINPVKLSGLCGRLKCCLNYELDVYMDALKNIPKISSIETELGVAYLQKTDIFRKKMWFSYKGTDNTWYPIAVEDVLDIIEMNKKGEKPPALSNSEVNLSLNNVDSIDFVDVVGQADTSILDKTNKRKRRKKKRKNNNKSTPENNTNQPNTNDKTTSNNSQQNKRRKPIKPRNKNDKNS